MTPMTAICFTRVRRGEKSVETDELPVVTDGGYSNAAEVARCVKAEAALSVFAFNILHAVNAFGGGSCRR
jgi:hypothetical protein